MTSDWLYTTRNILQLKPTENVPDRIYARLKEIDELCARVGHGRLCSRQVIAAVIVLTQGEEKKDATRRS